MHTVPQTQTNSVSLYLHYFFRLKIGKIQQYVFLIMNIQITRRSLLSSTIICNDFTLSITLILVLN